MAELMAAVFQVADAGRAPSGRRMRVARVALVIVSACLSVALLEAVCRATGVFTHNYPAPGLFIEDRALGYAMAPDYTGTYRKGGRAFAVETNAQGFRDQRDFRVHHPTARRILAVGDSFVFGMPVERDDAIVAHIERELNRFAGAGAWQVFNAGVPGYGTRQELLVLERWLDSADPAAVLLGFCLDNDISDNRHPPQAPANRAYHGTLVTPEVVANSESFLLDSWYRSRLMLRSSVLYSTAERALLMLTGGGTQSAGVSYPRLASASWSADLEAGWLETQRAFEAIIAMLAARRTPFAVLVIPSKTEIRSTRSGDLSRPRQLVLQFLARHGVQTIDPSAELIAAADRGSLFEEHGTHLLEAGNEIVGELVARHLRPWLSPFISDHGHGAAFNAEGLSRNHGNAPDGIFIAQGPGIRAGARLERASLLDVAPTVLRALGYLN